MILWASKSTRRRLLAYVLDAMTMAELAQVRHVLDRNSIRRRFACLRDV